MINQQNSLRFRMIGVIRDDMTDNLVNTLIDYVRESGKWFRWYHDIERLKAMSTFAKEDGEDEVLEEYGNNGFDPTKVIEGFLNSTLDEARLKKANEFAEYALYISNKKSFAYFRHAESRREMSGEIDYAKHRDHAVHTLYNYLLGWYIFEHSEKFQNAFRGIFAKILEPDKLVASDRENEFYNSPEGNTFGDKAIETRNLPLINHFGDVWPMASLLHDIGYILEGSLSSATSEIEHVRVSNGAKVLHDYFNHWAWRRMEVDFRAARSIAGLVGCKVPDFKASRSLPSLGDHLRDIGNLENIRKECKCEPKREPLSKDEGQFSLNLEAFSLWKLFYERYNFSATSERILAEVKNEYLKDVWEGGSTSQRNLNHGVCGGLILLQAATFWNEWLWGCKFTKWEKIEEIQTKRSPEKGGENVSEKVFEDIKKITMIKRIPAHISLRGGIQYTDWIKELWATASVAIHDYVSKDTWNVGKKENDKRKPPLKICLKEDPLSYLEILVDILQEWDRYTVFGEAAFSGAELLQSYETKLAFEGRKLKITYPKRDNVKKEYCSEVGKSLNRVLDSWRDYVELFQEDRDGNRTYWC